jgi:hypothetical protein
MTRQWWRLGGALGLIFVILFIIGVIVQGSTPMYDDPVDKIRQSWVDNGDTYLAADFILGIAAVVFYLPFLSALYALLGMAEGGPQIWSRAAFAGGIVGLITAATGGAGWGVLAMGIGHLSDDSVLALMYLDAYASNFITLGFAVMILSSSLIILRTGVLWRWLAYLGFVVGVLGILTPLGILSYRTDDPLDFIGFAGFLGTFIWFLAVSLGMLMKKEEPVAAMGTMSMPQQASA